MSGRTRNLVSRVERAWFAGVDSGAPSSELFARWFGKSPETDAVCCAPAAPACHSLPTDTFAPRQAIKAEFEGDLAPAASGEYRDLEESADGTLALIILFECAPAVLQRP